MAKRTAKEAVMDTAALDRWQRLVKTAIGVLRYTGPGSLDKRRSMADMLGIELGMEQERRDDTDDN